MRANDFTIEIGYTRLTFRITVGLVQIDSAFRQYGDEWIDSYDDGLEFEVEHIDDVIAALQRLRASASEVDPLPRRDRALAPRSPIHPWTRCVTLSDAELGHLRAGRAWLHAQCVACEEHLPMRLEGKRWLVEHACEVDPHVSNWTMSIDIVEP